MRNFLKQLRPAFMCLLVMTLVCGVIYTGAVTAVAQLVFPKQANGCILSVTLKDGTKKEYGSKLIAQAFTKPEYLIGRPMMVTNLSPVSGEQKKLVEERIEWWHSFDTENAADIPMDLVTAPASGVDPNISPEAAYYQSHRIAKARNMSEDEVNNIIEKHTTGRFLGFIGEPSVNVLLVNLELDKLI